MYFGSKRETTALGKSACLIYSVDRVIFPYSLLWAKKRFTSKPLKDIHNNILGSKKVICVCIEWKS